MLTFPAADPSQAALLRTMISTARSLNDARRGRDPDEINHEYARGQAELICDTTGLGTDDKEAIIAAITLCEPVTITITDAPRQKLQDALAAYDEADLAYGDMTRAARALYAAARMNLAG